MSPMPVGEFARQVLLEPGDQGPEFGSREIRNAELQCQLGPIINDEASRARP